jgi:folate-binding protein YgfZ
MSLTDQIATLREGAALVRHGQRTLARATGGDLLPWLERIASLPVNDMSAGEVRALTLMDGKGKLRADPRVIATGAPAEGVLLDLPASHREQVVRLLTMYVITDDVTVEDLVESHVLITVAGPGAGEHMTAAGLPTPDAGRAELSGELVVLASELSGTGGFDLVGPTAAVDAAAQSLTEGGVSEASLDALQVVRVGSGVPWFASDLADGVIPLEALLDRKVSTTKGCYPGQEVVARIVNLGQVARKLVRFVGPAGADLAPGAELDVDDGRKVGVITSVVADPAGDRTLALGYAKRSHWKTGSEVRAGEVTLQVESLAD